MMCHFFFSCKYKKKSCLGMFDAVKTGVCPCTCRGCTNTNKIKEYKIKTNIWYCTLINTHGKYTKIKGLFNCITIMINIPKHQYDFSTYWHLSMWAKSRYRHHQLCKMKWVQKTSNDIFTILFKCLYTKKFNFITFKSFYSLYHHHYQ